MQGEGELPEEEAIALLQGKSEFDYSGELSDEEAAQMLAGSVPGKPSFLRSAASGFLDQGLASVADAAQASVGVVEGIGNKLADLTGSSIPRMLPNLVPWASVGQEPYEALASGLRGAAQQIAPPEEQGRGNFMTEGVPRTLGGMVPGVVAGAVNPALGAAAFGAQGGGPAYFETLASTGSEEKALVSMLGNAGLAQLERLGAGGSFTKLAKKLAGSPVGSRALKSIAGTLALGSAKEVGTETLEQIGSDLIKAGLTDAEVSVLDNALAVATDPTTWTVGLLGGVADARRRAPTPPGKPMAQAQRPTEPMPGQRPRPSPGAPQAAQGEAPLALPPGEVPMLGEGGERGPQAVAPSDPSVAQPAPPVAPVSPVEPSGISGELPAESVRDSKAKQRDAWLKNALNDPDVEDREFSERNIRALWEIDDAIEQATSGLPVGKTAGANWRRAIYQEMGVPEPTKNLDDTWTRMGAASSEAGSAGPERLTGRKARRRIAESLLRARLEARGIDPDLVGQSPGFTDQGRRRMVEESAAEADAVIGKILNMGQSRPGAPAPEPQRPAIGGLRPDGPAPQSGSEVVAQQEVTTDGINQPAPEAFIPPQATGTEQAPSGQSAGTERADTPAQPASPPTSEAEGVRRRHVNKPRGADVFLAIKSGLEGRGFSFAEARDEGEAIGYSGSRFPTFKKGNAKIGLSSAKAVLRNGRVSFEDTLGEYAGSLHVDAVFVPEGERGSGEASSAMKDLLDVADELGVDLTLEPHTIKELAGKKSLTTAQLVKWYRKLGFRGESGSNRLMRRKAAQPASAPIQTPSEPSPEVQPATPPQIAQETGTPQVEPEPTPEPAVVPAAKPKRRKTKDGAPIVSKEEMAKVEALQEELRAAVNNPDLVGRQRADRIEGLRNLIEWYQSPDALAKLERGFEGGDEVAYTGVINKDGFREFIRLDGAKAGLYGVAATPEQRTKRAEQSKAEWREMQEGFSRVKAAEKAAEQPPTQPSQPERPVAKPAEPQPKSAKKPKAVDRVSQKWEKIKRGERVAVSPEDLDQIESRYAEDEDISRLASSGLSAKSFEAYLKPKKPKDGKTELFAGGPSPVSWLPKTSTEAKRVWKKWFSSAGDAGRDVRRENELAEGATNAEKIEMTRHARALDSSMKAIDPKWREGDLAETVDSALEGDAESIAALPEDAQAAVANMRAHVDRMIRSQVKSGGVIDPEEMPEFAKNILGSQGTYARRSYKAHLDPEWKDKVPADVRQRLFDLFQSYSKDLPAQDLMGLRKRAATRTAAGEAAMKRRRALSAEIAKLGRTDPKRKALIEERKKLRPLLRERTKDARAARSELVYRKEFKGKTDAEIDAELAAILQDASEAATNPFAAIRDGKLGRKDLSLYKRRKEIPAELRAFLGEIKDPIANYATTVVKISQNVARHEAAVNIRKIGLGKFLFEKPTGKAVAKLTADGNKTLTPLDGLYVTPEMKQALVDLGQADMPGFIKLFAKVNSFIKWGKVILQPWSFSRNLLGNAPMSIANGHLPNYTGKADWAIAFGKGELEEQKRLTRLGVINDNISTYEWEDAKRAAKLSPDELAKGALAAGPAGSLKRAAEVAFQAADNAPKIAFFYAEEAHLKDAGYSDAEAEKMAADRTRDLMPTPERMGQALKRFRRQPFFGAFFSFRAEVVRTTANRIRLIAEEIKSDNPKVRAMGYRRAAGQLTAATMVPATVYAVNAMRGIDADEDEDRREFLPPWDKNSRALWFGDDLLGSYFDLSDVDPFTMGTDPIMRVLGGGSAKEAIAGLVREELSNFVGPSPATQLALDIYRGEDRDGKPIDDMFDHILRQVQPGLAASARRAFEKGDPLAEAASVAGFRRYDFDVKKSLGFDVDRYKGLSSDATRKQNRQTAKSPEDAQRFAEEAEMTRKELFDQIASKAQAAIRLGMSVPEVRKMLDESLSRQQTNAILSGTYRPKKANK